MTVSRWAEKNREVIRGPKQGPWSNEFAPYAVKAMDLFNEPHIQKIVLKHYDFPAKKDPDSGIWQITTKDIKAWSQTDTAQAVGHTELINEWRKKKN